MHVHLETQGNTLYERVGGEPFFVALVEHFYAGVAADDVLRPLYPEEDLTAALLRIRAGITHPMISAG